MAAVLGGVMLPGLFGVVGRVHLVAVSYVRMVSGLLMIAGFVMLRGFAMMFGCVLVVLGCLMMVRSAFVI